MIAMLKDFVKRNQGACVVTAGALVVIAALTGYFLKINHDARDLAESNYTAFLKEQEARLHAQRNSVPVFLEAATFSIQQKKFDRVLSFLDVVLEFEPDNAPGLLRKGQVLIVQRQFASAKTCLTKYLELMPDDADARELVNLCDQAGGDDAAVAFGNVFTRQKEFVLAESMFKSPPLPK